MSKKLVIALVVIVIVLLAAIAVKSQKAQAPLDDSSAGSTLPTGVDNGNSAPENAAI